jgi:hypothetical protein
VEGSLALVGDDLASGIGVVTVTDQKSLSGTGCGTVSL